MATSVRLLLVCIVPVVASLILPMKQSNGNPDIISIINHVALMEQQMDALQKQVQTSNMKIDTLTTELKTANEKISSLEKQVIVLTHDHGRVEAVTKNVSTIITSNRVDGCKMEIEALRTSAEANFTRLHGLIQENQKMLANTSKELETANEKISSLEKQGIVLTHDKDVAVAFQTVLHTPVTVENEEYFKFDLFPINRGGAYNKYTGVFTVPTTGVYMIWAHIASNVASPFEIQLVLNGIVVVGGSSSNQVRAAASFLYISEFQKGDSIALKNYQVGDKTVLDGWGYSSFGGVLIGK